MEVYKIYNHINYPKQKYVKNLVILVVILQVVKIDFFQTISYNSKIHGDIYY